MSMQGRLLQRCVMTACACLVALSPCAARAQGEISSQSKAIPNPDDPIVGDWKYCLERTWDTGAQHGVSHFTLLLGLEEWECVCEEFPFAARDAAGYSTGVDSSGATCTVYSYATFDCRGIRRSGSDSPS